MTAAISLVQHLRSASADAEEDYWSVLPAIVKGAGSTDGDVVTAAVERWVLSQRWDKVLERVPGDGSGMFLVSHAGHVGLAVAPPFTAKRVLVIFDPTQLARLAAGFQSALAHAATAMTATLTPQLVTDTIVDLSARPWPPAGFADPTPQEATEDLLRRHRAFVARTPYVRPAENNLPASAIE